MESSSLILVLSPYHLTGREPAAVAGIQLAERLVTYAPTPFHASDRDQSQQVAQTVPRYIRLMEMWEWSLPLWREGIIGSNWCGEDAARDVRAICERIATDDDFEPLRRFMHDHHFVDERAALDAIAADVIKSGPDPSVSIPLAAGLDRFAREHGLVPLRSSGTSISQRAEARLSEKLAAIAVPLLIQGSTERLMEARIVLEDELDDLRRALAAVCEGEDIATLAAASERYAAAFERERDELLRPDDDFEPRAVASLAAVSLCRAPEDVVLRSSVRAARAVAQASTAPENSIAPNTITTLEVRVMGR